MPERRCLLMVFALLCAGQIWAQPRPGVTAADALILEVYGARAADRYEEAAQAYLAMLAALDGPLTGDEAAMLVRHLRALALVLPPSLRTTLALDEVLRQGTLDAFPQGGGRQLVYWWRQQDTLPATPGHERLQEHLGRFVYALTHFDHPDDPRGFDDRGAISVRLGAPARRESVLVDPTVVAFDLQQRPSLPRMPDNEVWVYSHVGDAAYFIFIQDGRRRPYRLGTSVELLPAGLRERVTGSRRSRRHAADLLLIMEEVYGQLALLHPAFGVIYDPVATHNALPPPSAGLPGQVAQSVLLLARGEDSTAEARRADEVPDAYTATLDGATSLAIPVRWARFLEPDGTTRTELYWGLHLATLQPARRLVRRRQRQGHHPSERYLLSASAVQLAADFTPHTTLHKHYLVSTAAATRADTTMAGTLIVKADTDTFHVALQWEQRWTLPGQRDAAALEPGARLQMGTWRQDTLTALDGTGTHLEASDLKPMRQPPHAVLAEAVPHPFAPLPDAANLVLYFELYHLQHDADGQTHYTIAYEVTRDQPGGLLPRLLGRDGLVQTGARTPRHGQRSTEQEYVVLDLQGWAQQGTLRVTVHITDEVSGAQVTRSITFLDDA